MQEYSVTKYDPQYYNEESIYTRDEWTNRCDVGEVFDGKVFELDEYVKVEK